MRLRVEITRALCVLLGVLLLSFGLVGQAAAWGFEGHRIIADVAEHYLNPKAARQIHSLLAIENKSSLADVATWADEIRRQRTDTARWHYVDIPIHPPFGTPSAYDPIRDCPEGDCVVAKIDEFAAVLHDKSASPKGRLEALKFLIHFVADVHQPLHCANDNDRGGNEIAVEYDGNSTNLHALWDTGILSQAVDKTGAERAYALRLLNSITPTDLSRWRHGNAAAWATDSYWIARKVIYRHLPHDATFSQQYSKMALPIVNRQLEKAGVRLAMVLNAALR